MKLPSDRNNLIFERIANNDPLAFKVFYNTYYNKLLHYVSYFESDVDQKKDIISDVFTQIWISRKSLPKVVSIDNYLFKCVYNQVIHSNKKNKISQFRVSLDENFNVEDNLSESVQEKLEREELRETIKSAINSLPTRCRLIYMLVKEEKMKYREVANALSISEKTIQAQMIIAVKKLGCAIRNVYKIDELF